MPVREPAFLPRSVLEGRDARTLARELLSMSQAEFSVAFRGSPMKRAKLRGLKRNASVVLGNVGSAEDVPSLIAAHWRRSRRGSQSSRTVRRCRIELSPWFQLTLGIVLFPGAGERHASAIDCAWNVRGSVAPGRRRASQRRERVARLIGCR